MLRFASVAFIMVTLLFCGAEAELTINKRDAAFTASRASQSSGASRKEASTLNEFAVSSRLARGSTARNVAAAQYVAAANRGFFSWWPSFGWRWFMGWWASKSTSVATAAAPSTRDAKVLSKSPTKLDDLVDTTVSGAAGHNKTTKLKDIVRAPKSRKDISRSLYDDGARETGAIEGQEGLDELGYQTAASFREEEGMVRFIHRVLVKEGLNVVDQETLYDVVKFYNGECATQSYRNLVEELHRAEHPYLCHQAWTAKSGQAASTSDAGTAALALLGEQVLTGSAAEMPPNIGSMATLNEVGYQAVARARSTQETMAFIERVLGILGLKVTDRAGLLHFAPYYSGECARQSFTRLVKELKRAPTLPSSCGGGWVGDARL